MVRGDTLSVFRTLLLSGAALSSLVGSAAFAQEVPAGNAPVLRDAPTAGPSAAGPTSDTGGYADIIVTARKRDETSIAVPVTITAVGGAELQRRGIVSLDALTTIVPALLIGSTGGSIQGGNVVVRGLGGADSNPFADQAVSFNVDGVQVARANIRRIAEMDLAQIEVLKGPQALFFGKNSPGGIISIRSADPTKTLQAKASVGYEFNARQVVGDGFVSGPLTDTLGARVAVYASGMRGWENNNFADTSIYSPKDKHTPRSREVAVRGTLRFEPSDAFNARLKISYGRLNDSGLVSSNERLNCVSGVPQLGGGPDDCKLDGQTARRDLGPVLAQFDSRYPSDGVPYQHLRQALGSYEMNGNLTDTLTLTSLTGYYWLKARYADNFNLAFDPNFLLANAASFGVKEFTQELRLASSFDGPLNFLAGGFYQHSNVYTGSRTFLGVVTPTQINNYFLRQKGDAFSGFGQLTYKPVNVIELSAGGRYSYERKSLPEIDSSPGIPGPAAPLPVPANPLYPRKDSWKNFSPEVSVAYRPNTNLTIYASYKRGFLSGGFNSGATNFNSDLRFDQEKIKGFEGGVKAALLDGALRTNLALYSYDVTGYQVTTSVTTAAGSVQRVTNAGRVKIKGGEFDFSYRIPGGFNLRGAVAYTDGRYEQLIIGCYRGQTIALGCNVAPTTAAGLFLNQDLGGARLVKAPVWTGSAGVGYTGDLTGTFRIGINVDSSFSSSYFTDATNKPQSKQTKYGLLDAGLRVFPRDEHFEVALIGRNLTQKYYVQRTVDTPLGGTAGGGVTGTLADAQGSVNRGREILLRLTFRYGN